MTSTTTASGSPVDTRYTATVPSAEAEANMPGSPAQVAIALTEPVRALSALIHTVVKSGALGDRAQTRTLLSTEPLIRTWALGSCLGRKRTTLTRSAWPLRVAWTPRMAGSCGEGGGGRVREEALFHSTGRHMGAFTYQRAPQGDAAASAESEEAARGPIGGRGVSVGPDGDKGAGDGGHSV